MFHYYYWLTDRTTFMVYFNSLVHFISFHLMQEVGAGCGELLRAPVLRAVKMHFISEIAHEISG
jgi:hypothetical protein